MIQNSRWDHFAPRGILNILLLLVPLSPHPQAWYPLFRWTICFSCAWVSWTICSHTGYMAPSQIAVIYVGQRLKHLASLFLFAATVHLLIFSYYVSKLMTWAVEMPWNFTCYRIFFKCIWGFCSLMMRTSTLCCLCPFTLCQICVHKMSNAFALSLLRCFVQTLSML